MTGDAAVSKLAQTSLVSSNIVASAILEKSDKAARIHLEDFPTRRKNMQSRRAFVLGVSATLFSTNRLFSQGQNNFGLIRQRESWLDFSKDQTKVAALEQAIDVMKRKPNTDPRSWQFQADIHGTEHGNHRLFNQCQHANWYFLPWHRLYLFHFEQILSDAAGQQINLPYWNYSNPASRAIPPQFRNSQSSLYEPSRKPSINRGGPIGDEVANSDVIDYLMSLSNFSPTGSRRDSFGGSLVERGSLEVRPHNALHNAVGGKMGDPNTAAQDPIFWLHHAYIDYLWDQWLMLEGGRDNPHNVEWLDGAFGFVDGSGNEVRRFVREVKRIGSLGYVYKPEGGIPVAFKADGRKRGEFMERVKFAAAPAQHDIGADPKTFALKIRPDLQPKFAAAMERVDTAVELSLEDVQIEKLPTGIIRVFVDKPDANRDTPTSDPHYAGYFAFFGTTAGHHHDAAGAKGEVLDITRTVRRLHGDGNLRSTTFNVTLVPTESDDVKTRELNLAISIP